MRKRPQQIEKKAGSRMVKLKANLRLLPCLVAGMVFSSGCGDELREASQLNASTQILAVRAVPAAIAGGETVSLEALVHSPQGAPIIAWFVCIPNPGDDLTACFSKGLAGGAQPPLCAVEPEARFCIANVGASASYTLPQGVFPEDGEIHTFFVNVLAADPSTGLEGCSGALAAATPTPQCLLALKRVVVTSSAEKNRNPALEQLTVNGVVTDASQVVTLVAPPSRPDTQGLYVELEAKVDPLSIDEVWGAQADPKSADIVLSWFATCGDVSSEKSLVVCSPGEGQGQVTCGAAKVTWFPKGQGDCQVHVVVRDGVGGTGFHTAQVNIP